MNFFDCINTKLPFFEGLSQRELELLAGQSICRTFEKGELLFYENDETTYWYILIDGYCKAYKFSRDHHEISLCHISEGMAVNEIQTTKTGYQAVHFSTVEALTSGALVGFKANSIPLLMTQLPDFAMRCFQVTTVSLERCQRAFYSGMVLDAMGKVAFLLSSDLEKFNTLKKQEIALLLNIQPETLSRILGKLVRKGVIEIHQNSVIILDKTELQELQL